ncbi:MAG: hypothetical protein E6J90_19785 [Deltaproteobacteria bacterium]|nr:MAG: hypothetical protein E6J90_19785 [Deltaproteobacteria bacterium]
MAFRSPTPSSRSTFFLEVHRQLIGYSLEAWLFVTVAGCPDEHMIDYVQAADGTLSGIRTLSAPHVTLYPLSGFDWVPAVLTRRNRS